MHVKEHLSFAKGTFFLQYGLLMFSVLLIPLLIFYGIFVAYYFYNSRTDLERSAEKTLANSFAAINQCFTDLDQMYSNFVESDGVKTYMLQTSNTDFTISQRSVQQINTLLNDYIISHQYIASIYVYKELNGYCLSSNSPYVTNNHIDLFVDKSCFESCYNDCYNYIMVRNVEFSGISVRYITLYYPIYIMGKELGIMAININASEFFFNLNSMKKESFNAYMFQNEELIYSNSDNPEAVVCAIAESKGKKYIHTNLVDRYILTGETVKQHPDLVLFIDYREHTDNPFSYVITMFLLVLICTIILSLLLSYMIVRNIYQSIHYLIATLNSNAPVNGKKHYPTEINYIAKQIISALDNNEQFRIALNQKISELNRLQLKTLQTQITPHFLFNSLNIVSVLLSENQNHRDIGEIIKMLSDILRYSIVGETYIVPFRTELEYSKKYLDMQNIRHNKRISIFYDISPKLSDVPIPKFTLQPILENAFSYGLSYAKNGKLSIIGHMENNIVKLEIKNNGFYRAENNTDSLNQLLMQGYIDPNHVSGLFNVNKRIKLIYGGRYGCQIIRNDENITITVSYPAIPPDKF